MGKTIGTILALKNQCSPQLKKIAEDLGISVNEAKRLNQAVKNLSKNLKEGLKKASIVCTAAIGAMSAAMGVLLNNSINAGDRIDKLSQKMQMSRQTFQELDYVFSQNGANIEMMQTGMSKLAKSVDGANKGTKSNVQLFKQLGISLKNTNGQMKSTEDIMIECISKLQKMPDGATKTAMALQLFGKSATELQPLLNGNAKSVDELRKKFNDLGMGMTNEEIDAAVKMKDSLDTIKRSLQGLANQIGADFLPILQEMADTFINNLPKIKATVKPIIEGFINIFKFLTEHIEIVISVATTLISTFVAFNVIKGVISTIQLLQSVIKAVTIAQGIWNVVMLANPIGLIAVGIGLLIGVIVLLIRNWDKAKAAVETFAQTAKKVITDLWEKIKPIFENIAKFAKFAFSFTPIGIAVNAVNKVKEKNALGTSSSHGGPSLVGEYGPEIVDLPQGSSVMPANKTQQFLQNGSNKIDLKIVVNGNIYGEDDLFKKIVDRMTLELNKVMLT